MRRFLAVLAVLAAGCTSGSADDDDDGATTFPGHRLVWIGDSYNTIESEGLRHGVETRAQTAGALAAGDEYRAFYAGGTQIANGEIPGQYDAAVADDPDIDTVVMDGGGNDVGIGNPGCLTSPPPGNAACVTLFETIIDTLETLWTDMGADGVEHVVYFYYPEITIPGGADNINYSAPLLEAACESFAGPPECRFVDPRAAFAGQPYLDGGGLYPNAAGLDVLSGLIWDEMVAGGIAQAP